jgi:ASC-1-like (ASCH) protein
MDEGEINHGESGLREYLKKLKDFGVVDSVYNARAFEEVFPVGSTFEEIVKGIRRIVNKE